MIEKKVYSVRHFFHAFLYIYNLFLEKRDLDQNIMHNILAQHFSKKKGKYIYM